jgi:signal transduction histidine kinase
MGGSSQQTRVKIEQYGDLNTRCDAALIGRVVVNLLSNALDFSPRREPVVVLSERRNGCVRCSIIDRGPGIPEEYKDRIFEKFGQVEGRKKGRKLSTGLGLAFCKLAVEAHGGTIGVESEVGHGSTFWFELPCVST